MTDQTEINTDSAGSVQARSMQQEAVESRTLCQPDAQLTPFRRDTHLGILIRWWDSYPNPEIALAGDWPC